MNHYKEVSQNRKYEVDCERMCSKKNNTFNQNRIRNVFNNGQKLIKIERLSNSKNELNKKI